VGEWELVLYEENFCFYFFLVSAALRAVLVAPRAVSAALRAVSVALKAVSAPAAYR
jgi:hypothetical protein